MNIQLLSDGRVIGSAVYEITSVPNIDESSDVDTSISSIEVILSIQLPDHVV